MGGKLQLTIYIRQSGHIWPMPPSHWPNTMEVRSRSSTHNIAVFYPIKILHHVLDLPDCFDLQLDEPQLLGDLTILNIEFGSFLATWHDTVDGPAKSGFHHLKTVVQWFPMISRLATIPNWWFIGFRNHPAHLHCIPGPSAVLLAPWVPRPVELSLRSLRYGATWRRCLEVWRQCRDHRVLWETTDGTYNINFGDLLVSWNRATPKSSHV